MTQQKRKPLNKDVRISASGRPYIDAETMVKRIMNRQLSTTTQGTRELSDEISTYLTRVIQARCSNCRTRETLSTDRLDAAVTVLRRRGWRVRGISLLCKECADG